MHDLSPIQLIKHFNIPYIIDIGTCININNFHSFLHFFQISSSLLGLDYTKNNVFPFIFPALGENAFICCYIVHKTSTLNIIWYGIDPNCCFWKQITVRKTYFNEMRDFTFIRLNLSLLRLISNIFIFLLLCRIITTIFQYPWSQ